MKDYLKIKDIDNVIVAIRELKAGSLVEQTELIEDIRPGHKLASRDIKMGDDIIKYGFPIGHATEDIKKGSWVHTHNVKTNLSANLDYTYEPKLNEIKKRSGPKTFMGYRRKNGEVGVRNELWVIPTVGCINNIGEAIVKRFIALYKPEGIDNIEAYKHKYGCSQLGDDHLDTRTVLVDMVKHPNAGGVLVLGLGCENNIVSEFKEAVGDYDPSRIKFIVGQEIDNEIEAGVQALKEIYDEMKNDQREEIDISELKVGLKCGGSDGFSGITANPLLGEFSDFLVGSGGTTILTEVPEMFGAEVPLMERAENKLVFEDIVKMINWFKDYYRFHNQPIYENPSPGNKEGGITTLEEKSLGTTQKSGFSKISHVLSYGERLSVKGLNLLYSPGNDLVSSTAMGASGCHMVLFTTGRGTPYGTFIPTIKVATNNDLFRRKPHWMDFNAGALTSDKSMDELADEFIEFVVEVASGKATNNELNGYREIAIFKTGVTL
ncbi:MAG: altronate dehydratase [Tissierellia bacterium]|nr:altronate dehydratase [Tissierellia bacterium]